MQPSLSSSVLPGIHPARIPAKDVRVSSSSEAYYKTVVEVLQQAGGVPPNCLSNLCVQLDQDGTG